MPRNYVRKTNNASYPREKLLEAVRAVKSGRISGYEASKQYGIPRSTIINRVYDRKGLKSNTLGRAAVLSREVEEDLVKNLRVMEKHGFGLTRQELLETVGEYVSANLVKNPFKNGVPGEDWFLSFKKRNNLSIKKPQPVEYARKQACSPHIIYPYFDLLEETINELGLNDKSSHIWNVDETSFSKDPAKSKVVGCKGFTSTRTIASPGKDNTTILLGCNALGEKTPPMIVFKGKYVWDQWVTKEGYPGTAYAATSNGWMETKVFENFFEKVFLKTVGKKRPILLLYDGHATHVGINLIKKAREANITIIKIPPHTSHLLQPLDLAVNKSIKDRWDAAIVKWQRMNIGKALPKQEFAKMFGQIWNALDPAICAAGFRKAGICPLNKLAISEDKFNEVFLQEWKQKSKNNATDLVGIPTKQPLIDVALYDTEISTNIKSQEPRAGTSTQTHPVFEVKSPKSNTVNPDSLLTLSLKYIKCMDLTHMSDFNSFHMPQPSLNTCDNLTSQINTEPIAPSSMGILGQSPKIQILENRMVTFEDLLLKKIKAGTSSKVKRKRVATGAEVITSDAVYIRLQEAEKEKKNTTKQKEKHLYTQIPSCLQLNIGSPHKNYPKLPKSLSNTNKEPKITITSNILIKEASPEKRTTLQEVRQINTAQREKSREKKKEKQENKNTDLQDIQSINNRKRKQTSTAQTEKAKKQEQSKKEKDETVLQVMNIHERNNRKKRQTSRAQHEKAHTSKCKRKRKRLYSDSSSLSSEISSFKTADTDESDYETFDQYITSCLQEQEEQENISPIPFGLSDIDYYTENSLDLQDRWIIVKFASKKSVKHFVGKVLSIQDTILTVKFARKVKNSKREKGTVFTYPDIEDICAVQDLNDVIAELPYPQISRRGHFIFNFKFDKYNIQ